MSYAKSDSSFNSSKENQSILCDSVSTTKLSVVSFSPSKVSQTVAAAAAASTVSQAAGKITGLAILAAGATVALTLTSPAISVGSIILADAWDTVGGTIRPLDCACVSTASGSAVIRIYNPDLITATSGGGAVNYLILS